MPIFIIKHQKEDNKTKKWQLVCSKDEINVDYEEIIDSETEPDFIWCNEIAQNNGCKHFYVYEIVE